MNSRYSEQDLIKIIRKEAEIVDVARKYGSSVSAIKKALYRFGYRSHKAIKIVSPYKEPIYVADIQKCADELKVSRSTIERALRGDKVPTLDELNIKIEYAGEDNYE